ncbi:S41 family peptidase [Helicobacter pylori]|uniref:Peptidase, S41 family n=1 Tax=Helicobacter pylori HP260AFii TaxID=1159077 RepID=A0ABC9SB84_HELPX|nr:S41 family peptidase [Helicobacter pylori]EMH18292.1 peptidase, S41 family [Helicobacter pylori GAM260ASi]EMH31561.1 peptidase, S41 family [Helicobacter pylori GAM268Bii]EMH64063.1 peptidase, S41 family [Helicobacter pylori HP260AFi]EMH67090.1 peptidase, S41 family [Helicobacter pylori HP260ASii]EMH67941.1 peptidase, S41 family [Helicobacter pylori HP260AFii]
MTKRLFKGLLAISLAVSLHGGEVKEKKPVKPVKEDPQELAAKRVEAFSRFSNVVTEIEKKYVDKISISEIMTKAIEGLLSNLDAHSAYLNEKKFKEFQAQTEGEFGGLGITVGMRDGVLTVIAPLEGTPAYKAGVKSGDSILKINNESTLSMSIDDAVNLMRGKPKTSIQITVVRKNEPKPLVFNIVRDIIKIPSVYVKKIKDMPYLYVRVNSFDKNVTKSVLDGLKANPNIKGVVLDLRGNPGGLLNQAVGLSNLFIKEGVLVSQRGKNKEENLEYKANGRAPYTNLPVVVLVNGGSASASEIVAGALQDHKRAIIIGEKTFGKGSVQVLLPVNKDEAIKITTARYYLPSGRTIQAKGITPDIVIYPGKVPENENKFSLKEADLKHHLEQELKKLDDKNPNSKEADKDKKSEEEKEVTPKMINDDIQLKTAIDSLKTWSIVDEKMDEKAPKKK